jgi:multidrug resistance protein, MATE family
MPNDDNMFGDDDGFPDYVENTIDPGPWLLLFTSLFCLIVMLVVVPLAVGYTIKRRKRLNASSEAFVSSEKVKVDATLKNIVFSHHETLKIVKLAVPFTVSALTSSTFSNMCLMLVSKHIGTKPVAAYALVQVLVGLTDGMLLGPISACTTLCSQAVGCGNTFLPGQYIQLAITFYLIGNIPVIIFWSFYMYEIILYLEWGDTETALYGQQFVRIYIWSYVLGGISNGIWQLLEVAGHSFEGTIVSIIWGATNAAIIAGILTTRESNLTVVGLVFIGTSVLYITLTIAIATCCGWFTPFWRGLFGDLALRNTNTVKIMLKQAVPLCWGSLVSNAEWAILTAFASHMGPAEVAAWAILGSIWDIFYSVTAGIGDAAEIRVAYHLGDNHPSMARLSAYKSLMVGMIVATLVSIIFFSLQSQIPQWFTTDKTLQSMLAEVIPFVGLANLTMTFGMQCWSLLGAQGKYKLATWVSFISSWGLSMPLAAIFVYGYQLDLQGLTSAVVLGYLTTGASLSYVLLSTDWQKVSRKIREQHSSEDMSEMTHEEQEEELYATVKANRGVATKANINRHIRNNVRLLMLPAGTQPGLVLGTLSSHTGIYILEVHHWSPLFDRVKHGDAILALDGIDVSNEDAETVAERLKLPSIFNREIVVRLCTADDDDFGGVGQADAITKIVTVSDIESGTLQGEPTVNNASLASMMAIPLVIGNMGGQASLYDGAYSATETALPVSAKEPFRRWYRGIFDMVSPAGDGTDNFESQNTLLNDPGQESNMKTCSDGIEYHEMLDVVVSKEIHTSSGTCTNISTGGRHERESSSDSTIQLNGTDECNVILIQEKGVVDSDVLMLPDDDKRPNEAIVDVIGDGETAIGSDHDGADIVMLYDDDKQPEEAMIDVLPNVDIEAGADDDGADSMPEANSDTAVESYLTGNAFRPINDGIEQSHDTLVMVNALNAAAYCFFDVPANSGAEDTEGVILYGAFGEADDTIIETTIEAMVDVIDDAGVGINELVDADDGCSDSVTEVTSNTGAVTAGATDVCTLTIDDKEQLYVTALSEEVVTTNDLDDSVNGVLDAPDHTVPEATAQGTPDGMACVGAWMEKGDDADDGSPDSKAVVTSDVGAVTAGTNDICTSSNPRASTNYDNEQSDVSVSSENAAVIINDCNVGVYGGFDTHVDTMTEAPTDAMLDLVACVGVGIYAPADVVEGGADSKAVVTTDDGADTAGESDVCTSKNACTLTDDDTPQTDVSISSVHLAMANDLNDGVNGVVDTSDDTVPEATTEVRVCVMTDAGDGMHNNSDTDDGSADSVTSDAVAVTAANVTDVPTSENACSSINDDEKQANFTASTEILVTTNHLNDTLFDVVDTHDDIVIATTTDLVACVGVEKDEGADADESSADSKAVATSDAGAIPAGAIDIYTSSHTCTSTNDDDERIDVSGSPQNVVTTNEFNAGVHGALGVPEATVTEATAETMVDLVGGISGGVDEGADGDESGADSKAVVTSDAGAITAGTSDVGVSGSALTLSDDGREHDEMSSIHNSFEQANVVELSESLVTNQLNDALNGETGTPENTATEETTDAMVDFVAGVDGRADLPIEFHAAASDIGTSEISLTTSHDGQEQEEMSGIHTSFEETNLVESSGNLMTNDSINSTHGVSHILEETVIERATDPVVDAMPDPIGSIGSNDGVVDDDAGMTAAGASDFCSSADESVVTMTDQGNEVDEIRGLETRDADSNS